ncbi:PDR ABC-type transporter family protein [Tanacetum coccineum]
MARRRKRLGAGESRPGERQSNDIPNNATINDNTDETTLKNTTENLNNPSNGRKQVKVVNGLLDKSSECSREITKMFKERIDDVGYTWTNVSQPTKNFYFGEFKKHFVWDPEPETIVRKAWDAKAYGRYADFFREIRAKMESIYKRPPTGFKLFLHTHTSGHDKITFINEKSKIIHDNVLHIRQEREENQASAESQVDETTLYIEATSGAKKRNLYGVGSKRVDYIKDIDFGNETTGITKVNDRCDSDSENTDGGDAHQGPNANNSRAGESNSRASEREKDDHDSRMIVSS